MSRLSITSAIFALPVILSACASETVEPIRPAPIYNKMGDAGCVDDGGQVVFPTIPGTAAQPPLYLPDCDELCDDQPLYDTTGQLIDDCLPDPQRPPRDDNDNGRNPTGTPGTASTFDPTRGA